METTRIAGVSTTRFGLGCWVFGDDAWAGERDDALRRTIVAAREAGVTHFDTAIGYGHGRSESLLGEALREVEPPVFVASKQTTQNSAQEMINAVDSSRERLGVEVIDLYYLHWPREGVDSRPAMEGLESCRAAGKIRAVGVSNFSCEQMDQVREVGTIDAHQFCYNLYWRFAEREVIPYLLEHRIAGVSYSTIAEGLLTGKYPREPSFPPGDQRPRHVFFEPATYPHLWEATERLKALADEAGRSLVELAIRWAMAQPGIDVVLVGARRPEQVAANMKAVDGAIETRVFDEMQAISDEAIRHVPDAGNIFRLRL